MHEQFRRGARRESQVEEHAPRAHILGRNYVRPAGADQEHVGVRQLGADRVDGLVVAETRDAAARRLERERQWEAQ